MTDSILPILGTLGTIIAAFFSYKIGIKTANSSAQKTELENVDKAIAIWRKTAEFAEKQNAEMKDVLEQNRQLLAQNTLLVKKIERLEREIEKLKKSV